MQQQKTFDAWNGTPANQKNSKPVIPQGSKIVDEKTSTTDPGPGTEQPSKPKIQKDETVPQKPSTRRSRDPGAKSKGNTIISIEPNPKSPKRINIPQRSRPCIACRVNIITKDGSKKQCKNKVYCRSHTKFQSQKTREAIKSQGMCRQHVIKTFKPLLKYHKTQPDAESGELKYNTQDATQLHTTLGKYNLIPYAIDPETLWYVLSAVRSLTETNKATCAMEFCRNPVFRAKRSSKLKPQNQQYHQKKDFNTEQYCYQHFIHKARSR